MTFYSNKHKTVQELAAKAFKDHVCELQHMIDPEHHFGIWRCAKPGTGIYAFRVVHFPGILWCGGDVADCEWRRTHNMIAWAKSAINSPGYFFEKVPQHIKKKEFSQEFANTWTAENREYILAQGEQSRLFANGEDLYREIAGSIDTFGQEFYRAVFENLDYSELPDCENYTNNLYWSLEAIQWFLNHYETTLPT